MFWGMTTDGADLGVGSIFSMSTSGAFTKQLDFPKIEGGLPKSSFTRASSGIIYGVTEFGGVNGGGILFEYEPSTGEIEVLHNFTTATGIRPIAGVVEASNGLIYGVCSAGGANNVGAIFEYNPGTSAYTLRVSFSGAGAGATGSTPNGQILAHSNGTLYGTCWIGGTSNFGTLWSYAPGAGGVAVLHNFSIPTGARPYAGLEEDGNSVVGVAQLGGTNASGGVLYSYNLGSSTYSVLYNLGGTDGRAPLAKIENFGGVYYGTASSGGASGLGTLFSYNPGTSSFSKLMDFSAVAGSTPIGGVIAATDGRLYGMTSGGSTNDDGVIYSYDPGNSSFTTVFQLATSGLEGPWGDLLQLPDGSLIGLTRDGGAAGSGGAFRYVIGGSLSANVEFGFSDAGRPLGRLIQSTSGLLYGTTSVGGTNDEGVLFSFNPSNGAFQTLFNFGGSAFGGFPEGTLTELNGSLFGTCRLGGVSSGGIIFRYDLNGGQFTKLINLSSSTGTEPVGQLVPAADGNLYTTTTAGGATGDGTILRVNPGTGAVTNIHDFDGTNGSRPVGDLFSASNGLVYGTTIEGGALNEGVLFQVTTGGVFTKLFDFDAPIGANPAGKLTELNGLLYGTTSTGASVAFAGGIYSWDIANNAYVQEANFNLANGDDSRSDLVSDGNGALWGTARAGGSGPLSGYGTVFRFNPVTSGLTLMRDFTDISDGIRPTNGLVLVQPVTAVSLNLRVFLQGPYNSGNGSMDDGLRSLSQFPNVEPYTGLGFTHQGEGGGESINSSVLNVTGNNAIVDWIFVELRDQNNSASVVNTRAALLQRDGDIVDLDGVSALSMAVASDNYYVSVRHRNHLGVMTAGTVALSTGAAATVNFTSAGTSTFGSEARINVGGVMALWSGNVVPDDVLKYTGANNDRDPILVKVGGSVPTATVVDYSTEDINLDGIVKYTGAANDRDPILVNVGGSVPTATRPEQLP